MHKIKHNEHLSSSNIHDNFIAKPTRKNTKTFGFYTLLPQMNNGDCIKFKCDTLERARLVQRRVSAGATQYCNQNGLVYSKCFTTRTIKNGIALFCIM